MIAYDLATDTDGDILIDPITGDFKILPSDKQHVSDILQSFAGWWKQFPLLGVGVMNFVNSSGQNDNLSRLIKINLQSDGYSNIASTVVSLDINDIQIQINADRV